MRKILLIIFVFSTSCTMRMPDNIKAESAVRRFLDDNYKSQNVQIIKFHGFMRMQDFYDQEKKGIYQLSRYKKMTEDEKSLSEQR